MKNRSRTLLKTISIVIFLVFIYSTGLNVNLVAHPKAESGDQLSYTKGIPAAISSAASGVGPTVATLNGLVNPNNESTTISFEYSTNANFPDEETPPPDTVAADPSTLAGSGYTAVAASITGLTVDTVYYFRVVATNASGTTYGEILVFSTDPLATVTTGIASPVTTTTATLNGTVNANSNSTTVTFEYGTTASYGTTVTADQSPVTGSSDTAVSKAITGLTPNTIYHYRVVGDNALGTSYGEDMTFFTAAQAAPIVTTSDPTFSLTANTATLHGIVNANNDDATVTFEYGLTTAYGNTVTADQSPVLGSSDTAVSKYISGLTPNTTYHYRAVATNGIGTTNGMDMTFYNTVAPYAKTELVAALTQTSVTLIGTVNPKTFDGGSSSWTTVVTFEYGLTASYGSTATAIESPIGGDINQMVSAPITGLSPNTTYHYRVVADNTNGTGTGSDMTFTTSSLPIATTESAAPVGTNSATLNGTVNANGESTTVTFEYGTTASYGTTVTADQSPATGSSDTAVSKSITGLANATTYHYRVVGTNSSGTAYGDDMTFTTGLIPPTVATNAATAVTTTSATMNGTVNPNGLSTTVLFQWGLSTSYGLTNPATPETITGSTNTAVTFSPTTLQQGTTYHYRVVAQNAGGTIYGADMSFTTDSAPSATTLTPTSVTTTSATLNGTVNANSQSSTVTFQYGTTTAYGTTVTADQSPVTGSTDTAVSKAITGLTPGQTYHFRVVATNASGTAYGADITFSTSVGPPMVTTGAASPLTTGAVVNGTVNANNASTTVTFEYGTTVAYGSTVTADQSPVTGSLDTSVSATLSGLAFNTTYHYRVVGTNSNGTTNGADMTFKTSLNPSIQTVAATNVSGTSVTLNGIGNGNSGSWSVRFDYGTTVAYGSNAAGTPSLVTGTTDTPFSSSISGLTPSTTYHYRAVIYGGLTYYGADMTFTTLSGPAATTNAATSVGSSTAVVNGTVNANNQSTTVTFQYGLDTSYPKTVTATQSPVTGNTNTAVSSTLGSLIPGNTYHYRVVATNANGTVYGADMTFATPSIAPTVTTNSASGVGATGATLNGTVNPNNDSTTVTFEYGLTTAYGTTVTADQSPVNAVINTAVSKGITGLTSNTTYHYRVVGQNSTGTTNGADMTFTTGNNTPTATTNTANVIDSANATLNGTVNPNGSSTTITFEYGLTAAYGKTVTADQSPATGTSDTPVTSTITGLISSTTYHYRVVAQNAYGTTQGADMTFLTPGSSPTATTDAASPVGPTTATLNGTVNAQSDSTTVTFEYGTTIAYGTTVAATPSPVTGSTDTAVISSLTGLTENETYHYRVVAQNAYGTAYGSDLTFTTGVQPVTVTITSPTDGAQVSGVVTIETTTAVSAREGASAKAASKVVFYIDNAIIGTDTSEPFQYDWDTTGYSDGDHVIKAVVYNSANQKNQDQVTVTVLNSQAEVSLNRTKMNFGAVPAGSGFDKTYDQTLLIDNIGAHTLSWTIASDATWLSVTPTSGIGSGVVSVGVDPTGLTTGTYTATLTVGGNTVLSDSAIVAVTLVVYDEGTTGSPWGTFATPTNGSTVMSSVPVTGWVLDDLGCTGVRIYRDAVSTDTTTDSNGLIYIGDANFVDGARPDVASTYPDTPLNYQAGWGYLMLSNGLPGDGTYTIWAIATDVEGNETNLGSKTITVDNANAVKPFGTIDTPSQGGVADGGAFVNFGWALTPLPNTIPIDGSTIKVWIDGLPLSGHPVYNQFRQDIANMFPGYNNSDGAVGYMTIDTTAYSNGVHTIAWSVQDDAGNSDGIGSRYFSILNVGTSPDTYSASGFTPIDYIIHQVAVPYTGSLITGSGYKAERKTREIQSDENAKASLILEELEPVEIRLATDIAGAKGYIVTENGFAPLPIGSTFNERTGTFSWLPGPGFVGTYHMVFVFKTIDGQYKKVSLDIVIEPKQNANSQQGELLPPSGYVIK